MFVKRMLQKAGQVDPAAIPVGNLRSTHLQPQLAGHYGLFPSASLLAYEPVQRLLAVASNDGRIKLLGNNGIQALLQSPWKMACKFLEFINNSGILLQVNAQNHIETFSARGIFLDKSNLNSITTLPSSGVWDFGRNEIVSHYKWNEDITSFYVIQGSSFILIGEYIGTMAVLQYVKDQQILKRMQYVISPHVTLGGLMKAGSVDAPCVVATLAQPDVFYSRVLIAYGNGLIVLWGLHENQVVAVRGGTKAQREELLKFATGLRASGPTSGSTLSDDDEEVKEVCCICWACPVGSVLAVGCTDGDILLWSLPSIIKGKGQTEVEIVESPPYSGDPIQVIDLAAGKAKMPVVGLTWCGSGVSSRGVSGRLYVFGGGEVGRPEALTVVSLDNALAEGASKLLQLDLVLLGPFADMTLLPPWPVGDGLRTPAAALVVLMSPGIVCVYEELSIANYFASVAESAASPPPPQPVSLQLHMTATAVTCAKLALVSNAGVAAEYLLQIPLTNNTSAPLTLPFGTKWPISGGKQATTSSTEKVSEKAIYLTGHSDGIVNFWDASVPSYNRICTVKLPQGTLGGDCPVSTIEFCSSSGLLAVGDERGMVYVQQLQMEGSGINCRVVGRGLANVSEELTHTSGPFACFLIVNVHEAAVRTIAFASELSRLAVGDANGKVSVTDLQSRSVIFYDNCFGQNVSGVCSLSFAPGAATMSTKQSAPYSSPKGKNGGSPGSVDSVLFVAGKDATMVALNGSTGVNLGHGPLQPKHASTAISLYLLDVEGAPTSFPFRPSKNITKSETESLVSPDDVSSSEESSSSISQSQAEPQFLLLCCSDSLRLYAVSAFIQGQRVTLKKVKLEKICCWVSLFQDETLFPGLLVLYTNGDLEFRKVMEEKLYKYHVYTKIQVGQSQISSQSYWPPSTTTTQNLQSFDSRLQDLPQQQLYDKDLATADAHASTAKSVLPKKASLPGVEGLLKGVVSGVIKELKNAIDPEVQYVHTASELVTVFSMSPFAVSLPQSSVSKPSSEVLSNEHIDIDDVDIEDEKPHASPESTSAGGLSRFSWKFKGKEKNRRDPEKARSKLFDGHDSSSKQPTVDDIRAKYGHPRKSQEISSVMEMARNKLMERGEKLQDVENRTSELENNAENFASMAEELAKRMAAKKWWEL